MPRLLVIGAEGQVGFEVVRALAPLGEVLATTRGGTSTSGAPSVALDVADIDALRALIASRRPDWIINASAYTRVDGAESEATLAHRVNAEAVGAIGASAKAIGARVVHYSTDYVFAGDAARPYREDDVTAPLGVYGATKLAGERALGESGASHLIFRTAWVYAARGHNFLKTMLGLAATRDALRVVADQRGAPTPARFIAAGTAHAIAQLLDAADADARFGICNLTASGETTWHGFAEAIVARAAALGWIVRAPAVLAITTADFPTPAKRPAWSVLDNTRLLAHFGLSLPDWRIGLDQTLGELAAARDSARWGT